MSRSAEQGLAVVRQEGGALTALPLQGEVVWLAAALLGLALTFVATRFADRV